MPIAAWNLRSIAETSPRYKALIPSTWNCVHIIDCGCNVAASVRKSAIWMHGYWTSARNVSKMLRPVGPWSPFGVTIMVYSYKPRQGGRNVISNVSVHRPATCPSEHPNCNAAAPISFDNMQFSDSADVNSAETSKWTVKLEEFKIVSWLHTSSQALTGPRSRLSGSKVIAGLLPWPTNWRTYVGEVFAVPAAGGSNARSGPSILLSGSSAQRAMQ
mmetsp:Transcript_81706/g.236887  ORF Transcript_81706/g.236887 Transcript_81706/m.236887 type:complete len:216 (+) Transcript_81706:2443-3090(+)